MTTDSIAMWLGFMWTHPTPWKNLENSYDCPMIVPLQNCQKKPDILQKMTKKLSWWVNVDNPIPKDLFLHVSTHPAKFMGFFCSQHSHHWWWYHQIFRAHPVGSAKDHGGYGVAAEAIDVIAFRVDAAAGEIVIASGKHRKTIGKP